MRLLEDRHTIILGVLLLLLLISYLQSGVLVNADGRFYYYPYVHSIVFDGDLDLSDDYREVGLGHWYYFTKTCTGKAPSVSPAGSPLMVLPCYAVTHLGVKAAAWLGADVEADGYSRPYQTAYCMASVSFIAAGLIILFRFLCLDLTKNQSLFLTILAFVGTPLIYYVFHEPATAVGAAFLVGTTFFHLLRVRWSRLAAGHASSWAIVGVVAGIGMMVRWEQIFYGLVPASILLYLLLRKSLSLNGTLYCGAIFGGGALLGFAPQLIIWTVIWGSPFALPQSGGMHWLKPFIEETLFSSRNGLFAFTPLLLVGTIGLFIGLARRSGAAAIGLIAVCSFVYINAAFEEWWGAYGFGMRRTVGMLAPLMAGCGLVWDTLSNVVARHARVATAVALTLLALLNSLFFLQVKQDKLDLYSNRSFQRLLKDQFDMLFKSVGYPFSWPSNWIFAWRFGVSPDRYDIMAGNYIFSWDMHETRRGFEFGADDDQYVGFGFCNPERAPGQGTWRWSEGPSSEIIISLFRPQPLGMKLKLGSFSPQGFPPQRTHVRVNGHDAGAIDVDPNVREYEVKIEESWLRAGPNAIVFEYSHTVSPAEVGLGEDKRQIAVRFIKCTFTTIGE